MNVISHHLVGRHTRENLQVLSSDDLMRPFHLKFNIVPDIGCSGVSLLLPFTFQAWPLGSRSRDLFDISGRRSCPCHLSTGDSWSNRGALPYDVYCPLAQIRQWLVLL